VDMRVIKPRWRIDVDDVRLSRGAWMSGPNVYVLGRAGEMSLVDLRTGSFVVDTRRVADGELRRRLGIESRVRARRPVRGTVMDGGGMMFVSPAGIVGFDGLGKRVAIDALDGGLSLAMPAVGKPNVIAVEAVGTAQPEGGESYRLFVMTLESGRMVSEPVRLVLESPPLVVRLLDGVILVGTAEGTAVLVAVGEEL
jgi:hypothetical protein